MRKIEISFSTILLLVLFCFPLRADVSPSTQHEKEKIQVGICVMATGKYSKLAEEMIASARQYLLPNQQKTFFVFTDQALETSSDVVRVEQKRLGWPYDTLKRFHVYYAHRHLFERMDYLFALDADMRFVSSVGEEILSDLVGTQHPYYVNKRGTYERNKKSTAYVGKREGTFYFAGGFYGGKRESFLKLLKENIDHIDTDIKKDFIAIWHDESHLNRYFINHPPTKILDPSYCYPENTDLPFEKKLLALDKNHEEMRQGK